MIRMWLITNLELDYNLIAIRLQLRSEFRTDFKEKKNAFDESYQKVCKFTHDQKFLITAGTDCIVCVATVVVYGLFYTPLSGTRMADGTFQKEVHQN